MPPPRRDSLVDRGLDICKPKHPIEYRVSSCTTYVAMPDSKRKDSFTLAEGSTYAAGSNRKSAFTLAEVLITLSIIGVVASLTMPALIDNHNKKLVETRLEKFYSSINQAIKMAELDYGAREDWFEDNSDYDAQKAWCEKYIIPYMNVTKTGKVNNKYFTIYFADGSAVSMSTSNGRDWYFFPSDPEKCIKAYNSNYKNYIGKCAFSFYYNTISSTKNKPYNFEPFMFDWNGTLDNLKYHESYGCYTDGTWHAYCTRLIQYNGWKFPKDYPFKVRIK